MKEITTEEELETIDGGTSISGTLINAFTSGIKVVLDLGRSFGSALRRAFEKKTCEL